MHCERSEFHEDLRDGDREHERFELCEWCASCRPRTAESHSDVAGSRLTRRGLLVFPCSGYVSIGPDRTWQDDHRLCECQFQAPNHQFLQVLMAESELARLRSARPPEAAAAIGVPQTSGPIARELGLPLEISLAR